MTSISTGTGFVTGTPNAITSQFHTVVSATASAGTAVPSYSAGGMPFGWSATAPSASVGAFDFLRIQDMLNAALGALVIGLVLGSISFGVVITKALGFFRGTSTKNRATQMTIVGMVLVNCIQMIATIRAVYVSVVVDFGSLPRLLDNEWSIMLQIFFMALTASLAHAFFASRLHAITRNYSLTIAILFFTVFHLATSIFAVAVLYDVTFAAVLLGYYSGDVWPMITTYSIATGVDIVVAVVGYFWLQKPYVLQKQGRTTFSDELEYWTVKSLFGCALVSLFNAIAVAVMGLNMTWLAGTFILGNLYTLSVLLTAGERLPTNRNTTPMTRISAAETDRASTATLTNDDAALWEDLVKSQAIKASLVTIPKDVKLPASSVGYYLNDHVV